MNRLRTAQRVGVVKALVEGNSIRSTVRLTGVAKNTVSKLLIELGAAHLVLCWPDPGARADAGFQYCRRIRSCSRRCAARASASVAASVGDGDATTSVIAPTSFVG